MSRPIATTACKGCKAEFPSKNAVFRHLKETNAACLSATDHQDFLQYVVQQKREKVILLYGYWIPQRPTLKSDAGVVIRNGEDVAQILLEVTEQQACVGDSSALQRLPSTNHHGGDESTQPIVATAAKVNRSYGHVSRSDAVAQEGWTGAITEVLATKLPPLPGGGDVVMQWMQQLNEALIARLGGAKESAEIRVLGRQPMPIGKFNAETDVSHRRVEYLLPADCLMPRTLHAGLPSFADGISSRKWGNDDEYDEASAAADTVVADSATHFLTYGRRPSEETLALLTSYKRKMQSLTTHIVELDTSDAAAVFEKQFHDQKRQRNRAYHNNSKNNSSKNEERQEETEDNDGVETSEETGATLEELDTGTSEGVKCVKQDRRNLADRRREMSSKKKRGAGENKKKEKVLRRKRFHNFTPTVMAHEFLSYRRMDRFYHRATLRFGGKFQQPVLNIPIDKSGNGNHEGKWQQDEQHRPFLALSISGDLFLTGQACRAVGLFIALARGVIDDDFVDCVFDEKYPHLVPTPPAPAFAMYAGDVFYINIEGKAKAILTPRKTDRYEKGWNDKGTIQSVRDWQAVVRANTARAWLFKGVDQDGRLIAEKEWTETVLNPWAERARKQLEDYRRWKRAPSPGIVSDVVASLTGDSIALSDEALPDALSSVSLPPLEAVDPTVPLLFEKVLYYLRKADASGLWPSTTPKRQLVMMSTVAEDGTDNEVSGAVSAKPLTSSLSIAYMKAKLNNEIRSSAYAFVEGQGGASGSFSLGAMPGDKIQPKGNTLFPELMKAAFDLEVTLCPNRKPSSTIAVNRNAQFRPHTDSGAGAGQSTSLIVGLGTYSGGELVVEGEKMDIRYKGVEFNGWKQRHWTMPFQGERYSLVWFTPKGCESINFSR